MTKKEKLYLAIDRAKGPGNCRYTFEGEPFCVIAHLASIEGVSDATLGDYWRGTVGHVIREKLFGSEVLVKYPFGLLDELQVRWDTCDPQSDDDSVDALRVSMKNLVDEYIDNGWLDNE